MSSHTAGPRPRRLSLGASLLLAAWAAVGCTAEPRYAVLVIVDTLRRDALSCYGNDRIRTPGIDSLAADGTRFDQAIASSGWTLPSVASILTGTWPTLHKARGRGVKLTPITPDLPLASDVFRAAGFRTLAFVNAAFLGPRLGLHRGFDLFDHADVYNNFIRRADATVDAVLAEIERSPGQSTFLLVHLFDPHLNYDPPAGHREALRRAGQPGPPLTRAHIRRLWPDKATPPPSASVAFVRDVYEAEVAFLDEQIGRLFDGLKRLGIYDRATVILTSDHGEEFWDHGAYEHGHTLYDELIRVPLIAKLPLQQGETVVPVVSAQVRTLDIAPTLFDASGVAQPASFVGASLVPLVRAEPDHIRVAFSEGNLYGGDSRSWRTDRYKYIHDRDPQASLPEQLYDWREDPLEQHNLAGDPAYADLRKRLQGDLERFQASLREEAAALAEPPEIDLSPVKNQRYLDTYRRLKALGYLGGDP